MAKVTAPLFSAAASGKFSGLAEFRMRDGKAIAAGLKQRKRPLHPSTRHQASRFQIAAAEWRALPNDVQRQWRNAAYSQQMTGYNLWLREYLQQGITPPGRPLLPS